MGLGRIGGFVFVAVVAALLTFVYMRFDQKDVLRCDIHPRISQAGLKALRDNLDRARTAAYNATLADKHDQEAAFKAGEQAAEESFEYDLRTAVGDEYLRHRRAMDNCF
jgi:hypothetical protein